MDNIAEILEEIGFPYTYDHFAEGESPQPPFICYRSPNSNNFGADGKVFQQIAEVHLELYTDKKDIEAEEKVESVLEGCGIFYNTSEVWIGSEKLYEVLYQFDMIPQRKEGEDFYD